MSIFTITANVFSVFFILLVLTLAFAYYRLPNDYSSVQFFHRVTLKVSSVFFIMAMIALVWYLIIKQPFPGGIITDDLERLVKAKEIIQEFLVLSTFIFLFGIFFISAGFSLQAFFKMKKLT